MIVFYSSKSGNTKRLVDRLDLPSFRITNKAGLIDQPFLLVTPTFADPSGRNPVPPQVMKFLNIEQNRKYMVGVVGTGNRNFGSYFAIGGKVVSDKCKVPLVHTLELSGSSEDISEICRQHNLLIKDTEQ